MSGNKTVPTDASVQDTLNSLGNPTRRTDALRLLSLFRDVTGYPPVMWGRSIVGFGRYHYVYESGREGDFLATGFSPRKANLSIYIMPGYQDYSAILSRLGKHKLGKSCLYINKLEDIDLDVLAELISAGLKDLNAKWPVQPV
ncbi:DUF1801 domain-containing protein [Thalassovita sp.]|uniref:DUF1801 domain-containing protein n=1 Tax=Thalassovita sp. TaxID=1979401 RepID=UPI0029DE876A|nr:DUF1801 domain-containing protein [Thalassovita sp.]